MLRLLPLQLGPSTEPSGSCHAQADHEFNPRSLRDASPVMHGCGNRGGGNSSGGPLLHAQGGMRGLQQASPFQLASCAGAGSGGQPASSCVASSFARPLWGAVTGAGSSEGEEPVQGDRRQSVGTGSSTVRGPTPPTGMHTAAPEAVAACAYQVLQPPSPVGCWGGHCSGPANILLCSDTPPHVTTPTSPRVVDAHRGVSNRDYGAADYRLLAEQDLGMGEGGGAGDDLGRGDSLHLSRLGSFLLPCWADSDAQQVRWEHAFRKSVCTCTHSFCACMQFQLLCVPASASSGCEWWPTYAATACPHAGGRGGGG